MDTSLLIPVHSCRIKITLQCFYLSVREISNTILMNHIEVTLPLPFCSAIALSTIVSVTKALVASLSRYQADADENLLCGQPQALIERRLQSRQWGAKLIVPGASVRLWTSCAACLVNSNLRRLTLQEHNKGKNCKAIFWFWCGTTFHLVNQTAARCKMAGLWTANFTPQSLPSPRSQGRTFRWKGICKRRRFLHRFMLNMRLLVVWKILLQTFHASPFNFTVRKNWKKNERLDVWTLKPWPSSRLEEACAACAGRLRGPRCLHIPMHLHVALCKCYTVPAIWSIHCDTPVCQEGWVEERQPKMDGPEKGWEKQMIVFTKPLMSVKNAKQSDQKRKKTNQPPGTTPRTREPLR